MAFISNFEYLLQGEDVRHVDSIKTKPQIRAPVR